MKKILTIFTVFLMVFVCCSCGSKIEDPDGMRTYNDPEGTDESETFFDYELIEDNTEVLMTILNGKEGEEFTAEGWEVTFGDCYATPEIDEGMVKIKVSDAETGEVIFDQQLGSGASWRFSAEEGTYNITVTVLEGFSGKVEVKDDVPYSYY